MAIGNRGWKRLGKKRRKAALYCNPQDPNQEGSLLRLSSEHGGWQHQKDSVHKMVKEYLTKVTKPTDSSPQEYWSCKAVIWRMSLLSISVQKEWVLFSHMGDISNPHCSCTDQALC